MYLLFPRRLSPHRHLTPSQAKKDHPLPVTALPTQPRSRPPLLLELDAKRIKFLEAVQMKGGVINIHVVRATADEM